MNKSPEEKFFILLNAMAKMYNFELDKNTTKIYDYHLSRLYSYDVLNRALNRIILTRQKKYGFPTVKDILDELKPQLNDEHMADEVANILITAIRRHGYVWCDFEEFHEEFKEECGEVAAMVVERMGGWSNFCSESHRSDTSIFRSHIRKLAHAMLSKHKAGFNLHEPPTLPEPETPEIKEIKKLGLSLIKEME